MSTRGAYPVRSAVVDHRTIVSRWLGGGTGDMTLVNGRGVASVVRTGSGAYTITFDETFGTFLGCKLWVESANLRHAQPIAAISGKTLTIKVCDLATPTVADVSATNEWLVIEAHYSDSGITQ